MRLNNLWEATEWSDQEQTIDLNVPIGEGFLLQHQISLEFDDGAGNITIPTTGTMVVTVKSPGGDLFHPIVDGTIDVTDRSEWIKRCAAHAAAFKFTPSGIDAGLRYRAILVASF